MKLVYGALSLFGDFLIKVPIAIWVIAFVVLCIWFLRTEAEHMKLFVAGGMLFYFMMICRYDIPMHLIGTFDLGLIVPIIFMLVAPYLLTLLTTLIIGLIYKIMN